MKKRIIITGGSGFVGQFLRKGLRKKGYKVEVFDKYRGLLVNILRGKYFGTSNLKSILNFSFWLNDNLTRLEDALLKARIIKPATDDILDTRAKLVERFQGAYAIVHLAGLAHPGLPGFSDDDYRRINYQGAVNILEAAKDANVDKFIFASSVAVYGGNSHFGGIQIEQFPILESNYCPASPDKSSTGLYGVLKKEFEEYLAEASKSGNTKAIALRLDAPGFRVRYSEGLVTSTSVENLTQGFDCALRSDWNFNFEAFNLLDKEVEATTDIDVQKILKEHWPDTPNFTTGNIIPFSTEKISSMFGYSAVPHGRYVDRRIVYVRKIGERKRTLDLVRRELTALISPGDTFILVDNEASEIRGVMSKRRVLPFLEKDGHYWGAPQDDNTAIQELERLRRVGATFIVFAWPAFWWLDYYGVFHNYLKSKFRCTLSNSRVVVFHLKQVRS